MFQISNESSFAGLSFVPVLRVSDWTLTAGSGEKTVYVRFKDASGDTTTTVKRIMYKEPLRYIPEGTAIKGQGSAVYYFGFDGKIHPFLNSQTFQSWYPDFTKIVYVSDVKLRTYPIGLSMCVRPGTWLVKFLSLPRVYAPEPGCSLRPLRSEVEAFILYGTDWQKRIVEFDPFAASIYKVTSFDVSDKAKNIVDKDRDGLDSAKEASFGSSDAAEDTDSDFLSDFEEIEYWFSDPNDADSDDDGVKDGREIAEKASPLGGDAIREVPANTYVHPVGSLLRDVAGKFYYLARDGTLKSVSTRSTDVNFTSNNFQERFAVWPPIRFKTTPPEAGSIGRASLEALRPKQTDAAGNVVDL
ncbi:MAG: hypothetical protein A3C90_00330 [Candidatus Magasanikbacteria bacterium RIFCSPHIGHO2_02_FULL_51_14]|uniref:Uncharacterized protein n=1 Tax=Candidatus Magasanikbacteria bacterium RIFCSPHIGHO2_02_FULL_51_14 TaxID=1798683 RepID=A0A1F6MDC9_9BACT|nr:MAG: hypothetical protein A3C90_00330 [Candidatus Magasanikbacteria bacterium RIFCSPHIGHO2_02_FULL_51_14]